MPPSGRTSLSSSPHLSDDAADHLLHSYKPAQPSMLRADPRQADAAASASAAQAWRSGQRKGPFTVDSGGGPMSGQRLPFATNSGHPETNNGFSQSTPSCGPAPLHPPYLNSSNSAMQFPPAWAAAMLSQQHSNALYQQQQNALQQAAAAYNASMLASQLAGPPSASYMNGMSNNMAGYYPPPDFAAMYGAGMPQLPAHHGSQTSSPTSSSRRSSGSAGQASANTHTLPRHAASSLSHQVQPNMLPLASAIPFSPQADVATGKFS